MTTFPPVGSRRLGMAGIAAAALLGAVGVAAMLIRPDLWSENPDYSARVSLGRTGWLVACCLAAALVRSDSKGLVAAWLGALVMLPIVVPATLSSSPTTAGDPFWTSLSMLTSAAYSLGVLALAFGLLRVIGMAMGPRRARQLLTGVAALVCAVSIGLLAAPPSPYAGPQPAPTYPGPQPTPTSPG